MAAGSLRKAIGATVRRVRRGEGKEDNTETASFPAEQPVLVSRSSSPATFCHRRANDTASVQRKSGATLTTCAAYRGGGSGSEARRATNTHAKLTSRTRWAWTRAGRSRRGARRRADREQKDAGCRGFMSRILEHESTFCLQSPVPSSAERAGCAARRSMAVRYTTAS